MVQRRRSGGRQLHTLRCKESCFPQSSPHSSLLLLLLLLHVPPQVTAWVPMLDVDANNGCIQLLRGGHRAGKVVAHTGGDNAW